MITLNGNKFALNDNEFNVCGSCVGFYKPYKHIINLFDMQHTKVGVITKHQVLLLATKLNCERWWYSYGDVPLVGKYTSTVERDNDINSALEQLKI